VLEAVCVIGGLRIKSAFHPGLLPAAIVAFAVFLGLAYPWLKAQRESLPFGFLFFAGYLACVAVEIGSHAIAALHGRDLQISHAAAVLVSAIYLLKFPLLALACIPFRLWIRMLRATSPLWLYASLAGMAAWYLAVPSQSLWNLSSNQFSHTMQTAAFDSTLAVLKTVLPDVSVDAATFTVQTPHYSIEIAPSCSGMEGLGLILAFTSIWLWYCRKECRFPQALLLIPFGLIFIWALNVVRLCVLFFMGNAGYDEIADIGFHSQAGWISFTLVALAFSMATQKLSWVRKAPAALYSPASPGQSTETGPIAVPCEGKLEERGESPAIRAYLTPFLAILAAAFISKAMSGRFEWAYPLRFVAAAIAIGYFWPVLKKLDWRFGWFGPVAGVAVFLLWIAPSWIEQNWLAHPAVASPLGSELASLSPTARWVWITFRIAAAVITVPIAEELAFRGYLARRLLGREFDQISFSSLTVVSIGLSSVVFGLEHMKNLMDWQHLILGTLAGVAFAAAIRWRGRMGDAVVAHAVSNLLLAVWVLGMGDWSQW
jgi:exosortase E/protease (VPEID-CTERM system)